MTPSLDSAQVAAARLLRESGVGTAALDARALLKTATGLSFEALIANGREPLGLDAERLFQSYVARRIAGEPVSRIRGAREFYGRDFQIDAHTLDPRPDTETLIAAVLDRVDQEKTAGRPIRILDLGTGSGCILITLLAELPQATGVGVDISRGALDMARENADAVGVADRARFVVSDWFDALTDQFDVIVSNPPYIASAEIGGLAREVAQHDPRTALDGGPDGLDAYRRIAAGAAGFLAPGGQAMVEIGWTQAEAVSGLFRAAGFEVGGDGIVRDLAGHPRCVCAKFSQA